MTIGGDTSAIQGHSPCPGHAVIFKPDPLDALLTHDISSREENLNKAISATAEPEGRCGKYVQP